MTTLRNTPAIVLIAFACVLGCKPEPPTLRTAKPTELPPATGLALMPPAKPGQSDPEARKKLDTLLAAHTGGKPELLRILSSTSYTRTGSMSLNGANVGATQTVDLSWPLRFKHSTEMTGDTVATFTGGLGSDGNWMAQSTRSFGEPPKASSKEKLPGELLVTLQRQMQEDACFLLFPFADPQTRVLPADDTRLGEKDCFGLHVWTPALEYALLHIDKKTNLVVRMAFTSRENARDVVKELLMEDSQDFGGVKLASKVYVRAAGIELAEWRSLKVTSGKTFDAKFFDTP